MILQYTPPALRNLAGLPKTMERRILDKMDWFAAQERPLSFAKKLTDSRLGSHRFRMGDYRVLVEVEDGIVQILLVLAVRHRKEAYKL
jgi:mRNA interferase RelE/StbE